MDSREINILYASNVAAGGMGVQRFMCRFVDDEGTSLGNVRIVFVGGGGLFVLKFLPDLRIAGFIQLFFKLQLN